MAAWRSTLGGNLIPIESHEFIETGFDHHHLSNHFPQQMQDLASYQVQNEQDHTTSLNPNNGEEDEPNCGEEGEAKNESFWPRVKWTDTMVKLLVTALSYIDGSKKKAFQAQKKGKWSSISKVMAQRGFHVSPRQCEDKFNDLNKRYKKLNEVLGRGTTCMVVENPSLLDTMNLSDKEKEEVKKIMSSKHLFYEEMCSYHNGNRLFLPHDRDLYLALGSKDEEDDGDGGNVKKLRGMDLYEDACLGKHFDFAYRSLQLEELKLDVENQRLELEKERFEWQRNSWEQDKELEKMKMENEFMRLENERMALEIEKKKLNSKRICNNGL